MTNYYKLISEHNKLSLNKPQDSDMIYYSELNEWYTTNAFRSFSVKCVLQNTIRYKVGATEYVVGANNFLLAMKQSNVKAYFHSKQPVKSVCIDICPSTLGEVFSLLIDKKDPDFDNYLAGYFRCPEFMESIYNLNNSLAAPKLKSLISSIHKDKSGVVITKEWIYQLVEKIVHQEYGNFIALSNIKSLKPSTRKEIYRRVKIGKDYIDLNFLKIDNIKQVAEACYMSEYYFFRSFKQVYNITPYQYLLKKRLEFSIELLKPGTMSLTKIAAVSGFPDIFTFSKAFKRNYDIPPSVYSKEMIKAIA